MMMEKWSGLLVAAGIIIGLYLLTMYDKRKEGFEDSKTAKGKIWQYEWSVEDAKEVCPHLESTLNTAKKIVEMSRAKPQDESTSRDISFGEKVIESYTAQMKDFGCERI
jgi:hypothetical protein